MEQTFVEIPWLMLPLYWILGVGFGYGVLWYLAREKFKQSEVVAQAQIENARREAASIVREGQLQARDESLKVRETFEKESWSRRQELLAVEDRINQREIALEGRAQMIDRRDQAVEETLKSLRREHEEFAERMKAAEQCQQQELERIQKLAGLNPEDLRREVLNRLESNLSDEGAELVRRAQEQAKATAEKTAREIIAAAVERYAADQISEMTTTTVHIPNEEMKGRIIGKDGRNIRALEAATGVNVVIDDTPGIVVISGFDPLRREIASVALSRLVQDGRIQPTRIEEIVAKAKEELENAATQAGEAALAALGLERAEPEVLRVLGSLNYRHSYGQNVLKHSIEMAHIMGMIAAELGADPVIAKRAGIFHDIGKAIDQGNSGSHALVGAEFLRKRGESDVVCNAVAAHHDEMPAESIYAVLTKAGDAITASRPGARVESTEIYLQRLEKLERIANSFDGVEKSFAIQAGREVRVIVKPDVIDDQAALALARQISKAIEDNLEYPGQIRVTVVRETRCTEYAR